MRAERARLARDAGDVAAWLAARHRRQSGGQDGRPGGGGSPALSLRAVRLPEPGEVAYLLVGQDMTGASAPWRDARAALQALGWRVVGGIGGELSHIYLPDVGHLSWHARLAALARVEHALGQAQGEEVGSG